MSGQRLTPCMTRPSWGSVAGVNAHRPRPSDPLIRHLSTLHGPGTPDLQRPLLFPPLAARCHAQSSRVSPSASSLRSAAPTPSASSTAVGARSPSRPRLSPSTLVRGTPPALAPCCQEMRALRAAHVLHRHAGLARLVPPARTAAAPTTGPFQACGGSCHTHARPQLHAPLPSTFFPPPSTPCRLLCRRPGQAGGVPLRQRAQLRHHHARGAGGVSVVAREPAALAFCGARAASVCLVATNRVLARATPVPAGFPGLTTDVLHFTAAAAPSPPSFALVPAAPAPAGPAVCVQPGRLQRRIHGRLPEDEPDGGRVEALQRVALLPRPSTPLLAAAGSSPVHLALRLPPTPTPCEPAPRRHGAGVGPTHALPPTQRSTLSHPRAARHSRLPGPAPPPVTCGALLR
jgi:hypothetical protein